MGWLDGRMAIVTGASKGIGRTLSQVFAREGAAVVCAARSASLVGETATLIKKEGGRAAAVAADLSSEDGARLAIDRLLSQARREPALLRGDVTLRDLAIASGRLDGTYVIRLFAEFETGLRLFWPSARQPHE